jgi:hypothetical protein
VPGCWMLAQAPAAERAMQVCVSCQVCQPQEGCQRCRDRGGGGLRSSMRIQPRSEGRTQLDLSTEAWAKSSLCRGPAVCRKRAHTICTIRHLLMVWDCPGVLHACTVRYAVAAPTASRCLRDAIVCVHASVLPAAPVVFKWQSRDVCADCSSSNRRALAISREMSTLRT